MSLDRLTHLARQIYVARCDECDHLAQADNGYAAHYLSRAHALDSAELADWRTDRTGTPSLCPSCAAVADCNTYGHEFGDWYACRCNGTIGWHATHGCPDYRYCTRCGVNDHPAYPAGNNTARREVA